MRVVRHTTKYANGVLALLSLSQFYFPFLHDLDTKAGRNVHLIRHHRRESSRSLPNYRGSHLSHLHRHTLQRGMFDKCGELPSFPLPQPFIDKYTEQFVGLNTASIMSAGRISEHTVSTQRRAKARSTSLEPVLLWVYLYE